ncbi:MAG: hypothetical protein D3912_01350 [Candidatus Electrothrix sp. AX1]|nr:hypothetical protein [Candidatus Electrothrix sp. AX1]
MGYLLFSIYEFLFTTFQLAEGGVECKKITGEITKNYHKITERLLSKITVNIIGKVYRFFFIPPCG